MFPDFMTTAQNDVDQCDMKDLPLCYTYLLTPWSRVLLEKLTGSAASQEIPRILLNPLCYTTAVILKGL
jgi:hypothetical protein